ncbi:MAG: glycosyltransferase family 2 protein [Chloroflexi bacterium]|nr:glycosyltransferase family 2 protein [Chloroflexota bacterium]
MKLSIIVCAYNERDTLLTVLERIQAVAFGPDVQTEIIVVDNCSTDGTRDLLRAVTAPNVRVILQPRNMGKGMSVRTAVAAMTGDYGVIQDADLEYPPAELTKLLAEARAHHAAAVFGSRVLGGHARYKYAYAYVGVRVLTAITNALFGGSLTDVATAIKMVRSDVFKSLNLACTGFDLDFELVDKILLAGHTIREVAIDYSPRTYAEGKKIKVSDGLRGLAVMLRDRLGLSKATR